MPISVPMQVYRSVTTIALVYAPPPPPLFGSVKILVAFLQFFFEIFLVDFFLNFFWIFFAEFHKFFFVVVGIFEIVHFFELSILTEEDLCKSGIL